MARYFRLPKAKRYEKVVKKMDKYRFPDKEPNKHKGEEGRVLIVGGSKRYYGAPIYNVLGAESAGADLITLYLPEEHVNTAKNYSLNLFINGFIKGDLGLKDTGLITREAAKNHVLLIGSGLSGDADTKRAIMMIISDVEIPIVLDADALIPEILTVKTRLRKVITPHAGEFERLFGLEASLESAVKVAREHALIILLKGKEDIITDGERNYINKTGCSQMRVGGTGDVLAGILASLISLGKEPFEGCVIAARYFGLAGEELLRQSKCYTAYDLAKFFPKYMVI